MSTVNTPHLPLGSEPSRDDDDPTGVRALLSSLRQPGPMPHHLVERINASLAAEQRQRAARMSSLSVTPLPSLGRRRPRRLVFAIAGAAAAAVLVAVAGSSVFPESQTTGNGVDAAIATTSVSRDLSAEAAPRAAAKAPTRVSSALGGSGVQISQSGTRYTQAGFVSQARALRNATPVRTQLQAASGIGPASTVPGLMECLKAIGVAGAQVVRADVASYEGRPAVIIVTTTNGVAMAYVVDPQCSHAHAAVWRLATPLP